MVNYQEDQGVIDGQAQDAEPLDDTTGGAWYLGLLDSMDGAERQLDDSVGLPLPIREVPKQRPRRTRRKGDTQYSESEIGEGQAAGIIRWLIDNGWEPDDGKIRRLKEVLARRQNK